MDVKNVIVIYKDNLSDTAYETVNTVKHVLTTQSVHYNEVSRGNLTKDDVKHHDLILVIGGDGTFLKVAQYVLDDTLLMGVNSNVKETEGFFTCCAKEDFEAVFKRLRSDKFKTLTLHRLKASIDGKDVAYALNEFYMGDKDVTSVAKYKLKIDDYEEYQKSSGVIVSTAAGSYAWMKSAGGKTLSLDSDKFQYLVREPILGRLTPKVKLTKDVLKKEKTVELMSDSDTLVLIADAVGEKFPLKKGHRILITGSDKPVRIVAKPRRLWW